MSRTKHHLDTLKNECPQIQTICVDLADWNATQDAIKKITPIHLLVNNAAIAKCDPVLEATPEDFDRHFNVNVKAVMNVIQIVASDLVNRKLKGNIVNISSQAGQRALKNHLIYCSAKAALDMMTKVFGFFSIVFGFSYRSTI